MPDLSLKDIECLESKYLNKFYYFLKYLEDEIQEGFLTKEEIRGDWQDCYNDGISDFSVGAERIIYSLINGKMVGKPNSSPVGSDLFFEVHDAFIHIDLKTVKASIEGRTNINDYQDIFIGDNQNSYKGVLRLKNGTEREYTPNLPTYYNKGTDKQKICLSYFITILYEKESLDILVMCIMCVPNGELEGEYGSDVLKAGKNIGEIRFNLSKSNTFELLENKTYRVKVVVFKNDMDRKYKQKLEFFETIYKAQD